jgi:outer membrane protein
MNRNWLIVPVLLCSASIAGAENLQTVYDHALHADPIMQQAEATHMASRETRTQAILNMLPLNAQASKNWYGVGNQRQTTPAFANLDLQVNLFSWDNWIALKSASSTVAQAEANYQAAREDLISRVTQQYFAVLGAADALAAQQTALESVNRQLEQAERRFEVGLIAITDVQIARAARDSTAAAVIAAKRTQATAEEQLRAITGEKYRRLAAPGDSMPLLTPDPASEDAWVTTALSQNSNLIANRLAAAIARDAYLTAIGGHLPSINASASRAWDLNGSSAGFQTGGSGTPITIDTQDIVWSVGITVPLFSAGATQSRVRQAKYLWKASEAGYESSLRQTELLARDAYQGVVSQIAQVNALKQAVESNRISLKATEAGYEVGTKTAIDVLSSRQLYVQAQTNYSQSKYDYLNNLIALRVAAGNLDRSSIAQINGWLVEPADTEAPATAPTATTPAATAPAPATSPTGSPAPAPTAP